SGANDAVFSVAIQSDAKVLIGGYFTKVNGVNRNRIARLNANGTLDTSFQNGLAGADSGVYSIAVQTDGKLVIGGLFTTVNGVSRHQIARLNQNGTLDTEFLRGLSGADSTVVSVALRRDGRVLIGGFFTKVNDVNRGPVAQLNGDGTLDS